MRYALPGAAAHLSPRPIPCAQGLPNDIDLQLLREQEAATVAQGDSAVVLLQHPQLAPPLGASRPGNDHTQDAAAAAFAAATEW
jgi:hypothetical protein